MFFVCSDLLEMIVLFMFRLIMVVLFMILSLERVSLVGSWFVMYICCGCVSFLLSDLRFELSWFRLMFSFLMLVEMGVSLMLLFIVFGVMVRESGMVVLSRLIELLMVVFGVVNFIVLMGRLFLVSREVNCV